MSAHGESPTVRKVSLRGLTRYQIGVLLEIYNRELIDAKKTDGGPVQALRSVVGAFGVGISASEARRIITAFGGRNATSLTFTQFLDFFEWFVPEILCQLHQLALEGLKNMDTMEISELRLSQTDVGFIEATLGGKEEGKKIKLSEDRIQEFFSRIHLVPCPNSPHCSHTQILPHSQRLLNANEPF